MQRDSQADLLPQALMVKRSPHQMQMNQFALVLYYGAVSLLICTIFLTCSVFTMTITSSSSLVSVQSAINQWEIFLTTCSSTVGKSTARAVTAELLINHWSSAESSHAPLRSTLAWEPEEVWNIRPLMIKEAHDSATLALLHCDILLLFLSLTQLFMFALLVVGAVYASVKDLFCKKTDMSALVTQENYFITKWFVLLFCIQKCSGVPCLFKIKRVVKSWL